MLHRFKVIPAVHLVLIRDDKILLIRRFNTGYEDGNYSVPAGHLDGDETAREAMRREAKEEAGLEINAENMAIVHVMHRKKDDEERIDFFIAAKKWSGEPYIAEPGKCDEMKWFDINNMPKNVIPYIRHAVSCIMNKESYSEFGW